MFHKALIPWSVLIKFKPCNFAQHGACCDMGSEPIHHLFAHSMLTVPPQLPRRMLTTHNNVLQSVGADDVGATVDRTDHHPMHTTAVKALLEEVNALEEVEEVERSVGVAKAKTGGKVRDDAKGEKVPTPADGGKKRASDHDPFLPQRMGAAFEFLDPKKNPGSDPEMARNMAALCMISGIAECKNCKSKGVDPIPTGIMMAKCKCGIYFG